MYMYVVVVAFFQVLVSYQRINKTTYYISTSYPYRNKIKYTCLSYELYITLVLASISAIRSSSPRQRQGSGGGKVVVSGIFIGTFGLLAKIKGWFGNNFQCTIRLLTSQYCDIFLFPVYKVITLNLLCLIFSTSGFDSFVDFSL